MNQVASKVNPVGLDAVDDCGTAPRRKANWRWRIAAYFVVVILTGAMASQWLTEASAIIGRGLDSDGVSTIELLTHAYRLDKVYMSMTGPRSNHAAILIDPEADDDETIWLTGIQTDIVDAKTLRPVSPEYFCHSNLTLSPASTTPDEHNHSFASTTHAEWRLFTLVPGRLQIELPDGFGLPVQNSTKLDYFTMALNQDPRGAKEDIRMRTRIRHRRERDASHLRPLFRRSLYVYQQHKVTPKQRREAVAKRRHQGEVCSVSRASNEKGASPSRFVRLMQSRLDAKHPGAVCCVANASRDGVVNQFGQDNTVHWMVPPGRHVYRSEVTEQLNLPFSTTVHYATGHLHPYGLSLTLRDIETGVDIIRIDSKDFSDRLGVKHMSEFLSQEGIAFDDERRIELIAEYDNTTDCPIDAMGIFYFYALDSEP